jgi:hypothetical protein
MGVEILLAKIPLVTVKSRVVGQPFPESSQLYIPGLADRYYEDLEAALRDKCPAARISVLDEPVLGEAYKLGFGAVPDEILDAVENFSWTLRKIKYRLAQPALVQAERERLHRLKSEDRLIVAVTPTFPEADLLYVSPRGRVNEDGDNPAYFTGDLRFSDVWSGSPMKNRMFSYGHTADKVNDDDDGPWSAQFAFERTSHRHGVEGWQLDCIDVAHINYATFRHDGRYHELTLQAEETIKHVLAHADLRKLAISNLRGTRRTPSTQFAVDCILSAADYA